MPTLHRECYRTLIVNRIKEMYGLENASLKCTETRDELGKESGPLP